MKELILTVKTFEFESIHDNEIQQCKSFQREINKYLFIMQKYVFILKFLIFYIKSMKKKNKNTIKEKENICLFSFHKDIFFDHSFFPCKRLTISFAFLYKFEFGLS